jgi:hypothetical protein
MLKKIASLILVSLVAACGGGGGDAGSSPLGGGSGTTGASTTADLLVDLSKATVANTGSDSVIVTVTALDAARSTIPSAKVVVSADSDAVVTTTSTATGADGKLQSTLTIGSNRANRLITVTVTSGSVSKTATIQVFGAKLTGTLVPAVIEPGKTGKVQYRLLDQAGNPMVDQDIHVVAPSLVPAEATGKTGTNGDFEFAYTAPATAGNYDVAATGGGTSDTQSLRVQTANTIPAVPTSTTIRSASVSANPSVVGTNVASSTSNRSDLRALFLTDGNVPIPRVRVRFDLAGDANAIGGTFTTGSEILYSDSNGVVTSAYVPGSRSSPTDGVTVRACYAKTDAELGTAAAPLCPNADAFTKLTVTSEPLGVSIGTNELIIVNELTYAKKFIVSVVDAAGVAKPDVNITVSVDLPRYRKGYYVQGADSWVKAGPLPSGDAQTCLNEDKNRNGVLESDEDDDPVNGNRNGRLDPGKSDVSVSLLQTKTRGDGTVELQLLYAKSFATWVDAKITVAASGVSGTEGRASYLVYPVPADAASIKNKDVAPAYAVSPYGISSSCTDPN